MNPTFTCPVCHRTSYNLNDVAHAYCGACHTFPEERPPPKQTGRIHEGDTVQHKESGIVARVLYVGATGILVRFNDVGIVDGAHALVGVEQHWAWPDVVGSLKPCDIWGSVDFNCLSDEPEPGPSGIMPRVYQILAPADEIEALKRGSDVYEFWGDAHFIRQLRRNCRRARGDAPSP